MTITSYANLLTQIANGKGDKQVIVKPSTNTDGTGVWSSTWRASGYPTSGSAPATKEAPDRTTTGAIFVKNPTSPDKSFILNFGGTQRTAATDAVFFLVDILSWSHGLDGTVTTAQTTNLPTTALTRYTNGEGVLLGLYCWTSTGTTAANVTASYTNQAGTAGRTTTSVAFWTGGFGGGNLAPSADEIQLLPLQSGDYGVRSVESVTLSASTLTAGDFGVVLFKPLMALPTLISRSFEVDGILQTSTLVEKVDSACLCVFYLQSGVNATGISGSMETVEG